MRHIVRFIGLIILAAGFIGIVVDGTRSMANTALQFSSLRDMSDTLFPGAVETLRASLAGQTPVWLWDNVCVAILHLPASVAGMAVGLLLLRLSEKRPEAAPFPGMPLR